MPADDELGDGELIDRLLAGITLVECDTEWDFSIDSAVLDLIDEHPELLLPEVDAKLAQRAMTALGEEGRQRLQAARRLLETCRQSDFSEKPSVDLDLDWGTSFLQAERLLTCLRITSRLLSRHFFDEQSALRSALILMKDEIMRALIADLRTDQGAVQEATVIDDDRHNETFEVSEVMEFLEVTSYFRDRFSVNMGPDRRTEMLLIACFEVINGGMLFPLTRQTQSREVFREAALSAFELLPALWRLERSLDLARMWVCAGELWVERENGHRGENQDRAIACFESALTVLTNKADSDGFAVTQNNLGNVYRERIRGERGENQEQAITCYDAALSCTSPEHDPKGFALTHRNLGSMFAQRLRGFRGENQERAIMHLMTALDVFVRLDNQAERANTLVDLGSIYEERIFGDRRENQEQAISIFEGTLLILTPDVDLQRYARIKSNLGEAYRVRLHGDRSENQERAIAIFKEVLSILPPEISPDQTAQVLSNLGSAFQERLRGYREENLEQAIFFFESAQTLLRRETASNVRARTLNNLGNTYLFRLRGDKRDNQERAIACFGEALEISDDGAPLWGVVHGNLAAALRGRLAGDQRQNKKQAIIYYQAAVPALRESNPSFALTAEVALGSLQRECGELEAARFTWRTALELRERLLRGMGAEARSEAAQRSRDLAARLALLEAELGSHAEAVGTLERGRALALREALGLDAVWLAELPPVQRERIETAQRTLANLRVSSPRQKEAFDPARLQMWEASIVEAEARLEAVQRAAGYQPPPSLDASALAALSPPGGAVVLLAVAEEGGVAYVLPSGCVQVQATHHIPLPTITTVKLRGILIRWLEAYRAITRRAMSLPDLLAAFAGPSAVLEEMLDELWRDVMGPVTAQLGELGIGQLVLLPQGALALLPLHAAGPKGGRSVLDNYVVSYAPSGYVLRTGQERLAQQRGHDLFGVFNPMAGSTDALPLSEEVEMPALADLFTGLGRSASVYAGAAATVDRVLEEASVAGYVHLSCHGGFDLADPEHSGLQLAGDTHLTVTQIVRELRLGKCRLVVLSACESGMVDVQHIPDEFVGLPSAFLQTGAPGVVATFWSVLDGPTAEVITRFYVLHIVDGLPPAAALRRAVLDLRKAAGMPAGGEMRGHPHIGEPSESDGSQSATPSHTILPLDLPPALQHLFAMPIVWAAYAYHGI